RGGGGGARSCSTLREEPRAAFVGDVEQRSDGNRQHHQDNVDLQDERRQKLRHRCERIGTDQWAALGRGGRVAFTSSRRVAPVYAVVATRGICHGRHAPAIELIYTAISAFSTIATRRKPTTGSGEPAGEAAHGFPVPASR